MRHVSNGPLAVHSIEGCGLAADDAGVRPLHPFLWVVALMVSAIVRKPLPKAPKRERADERMMIQMLAESFSTCRHARGATADGRG